MNGVIAVPLVMDSLAIAIVLGVVAWLEPNAVQAWLEKSLYFGTAHKPFRDIIEQSQQLHALEQGG